MSVVVRSTSTEITVSHKGGTVVVSKPSSYIVVAPSISVSGALGLVTGANVGGGDAEIFRDKIGTVLNFRTLSGLGGVAVSENGDVIEVDGSSLQTVLLSHADRHQHGGADEVATATPAANAIPKADGTGKLDSGWMPTGTFTLAAVSAADTTPGFLSDKIVAGAGLTSSILNPAGDEDLQLNIGANPDGSIVVGSDDIKVGVLATDAQHGDRGGGSLHTLAIASGAAGFLSGADKQLIDDLPTTYAPLVHASRHAGAGADPITSLGAMEFTSTVGIGTATVPHGGIGSAILALDGANASANGPHVQITTDSDDYPVFSQFNWAHDNISLAFDAYLDTAWRSSDTGSNFKITKWQNTLRIDYDSGIGLGSIVPWHSGLILDTSGDLQVFGFLQFGGQTNTEPAWKRNTTSPGPCLEARLADDSDSAFMRAYHLGLNTDPTATHMLFGDEYYSGTLNKLGIGMFPTYIPTTLAANNLYGVQGNVFFGGANWGSGSFVNALQFFPAPDYQHGSVSWGSSNLNLLGISTGGLINIFGRTVTSNTLTGIAVQTLAHIFGAPGAVSANTATAIEVTTPSQTTGTIGVQTGIEIQPQLYGTLNQGLWLSGDGAGSDIVLGAGKDVRFYYDGVDLQLNTSIVAPSDLVLSCGTDKTLELAETVWDDLRVPLTAGKLGLTNPPTWSQYRDNGAASIGVYAYAFSDQAVAANEEELWFQVQLPHNWKEGTDIKPHIHWGIKTAGAANEFVKWGLEYTWANIDGTIGATTIITSNASSAATATTSGDTTLVINKHYVTDIGTISGTGKTISSMLLCRVFRNSSHADDDLAQDAYGFEVDLHHEIDTLGSRQTLVK